MAKFNSMQSNPIAINFPHGCSPVNSLHIFRIAFPTNNSRGLLLNQGKTYEQQKVYINISINNTMSLSLHIEMREYNKFKFCYDLHDNVLTGKTKSEKQLSKWKGWGQSEEKRVHTIIWVKKICGFGQREFQHFIHQSMHFAN